MQQIYRQYAEERLRRVGIHQYVNDIFWKVKLLGLVNPATLIRSSFINCEYARNEEFLIRELVAEIKPNDVFYDVGANVGVFSLLVLNVFDTVDVCAFEPFPQNVEILRTNLLKNGFRQRARCFDVALSNADGRMNMQGSGQTARLSSEEGGKMVNTIKGDEFIDTQSLPSPTVLKMDIEGGEVDALKGLRRTLSETTCRLVFIEIHPNRLAGRGQSASQVKNHLTQSGFNIKQIDTGGKKYFIKATR